MPFEVHEGAEVPHVGMEIVRNNQIAATGEDREMTSVLGRTAGAKN